MQSRSRLFLQNISSMRVQRLPANFAGVRAMSFDGPNQAARSPRDSRFSNDSRDSRFSNDSRDSRSSNNARFSNNSRDSRYSNNYNSRDSRGSRPPRHDNGQRPTSLWTQLNRETSGASCHLSYVDKQARWNQAFTKPMEPTTDVLIKNYPAFITVDSLQSTFPALDAVYYRQFHEESIAVRFSSVEEAEKAVEMINNATEYPFSVPESKIDFKVDMRAPIRAKFIGFRATEPQTTDVHIPHYQGTDAALREKLAPYVSAGHTLQIRYGPRGQVWADLGSVEAVKEACEGLKSASYTCEIPLLVAPGSPPRQQQQQQQE